MDHVASLALDARELSRRLLIASETHSAKLARVFSALLSVEGWDETEAGVKEAAQDSAIGHGFALMFLLAGVTGMQPIHGKPAEEWMAEWKAKNHGGSWNSLLNKLSKELPRGYGFDIAGPLWAEALSIVGKRPDARSHAEMLMMDVYGNFMSGSGQHIKPVPLKEAIGLVQKSIKNLALNKFKREQKQRSITQETDEGEVQEELKGDHDFDDLLADHNARMIIEEIMQNHALMSELTKIHIDAPQYLHLLMQGHDDAEILGVGPRGEEIGKPLLKHPLSKGTSGVPLSYANWNAKKLQMFTIIKKHLLKGGHTPGDIYSYDRSVTANLKWELNSKIPAHFAETPEGTYWVMPEGHNIFVASFIPKGSHNRIQLGHKGTAHEAQKLAEAQATAV